MALEKKGFSSVVNGNMNVNGNANVMLKKRNIECLVVLSVKAGSKLIVQVQLRTEFE